MIKIYPATFNDLSVVADVHVSSWKESYIDQLPQSYLDALNVVDRQRTWEEIFLGKTAEDKNLEIASLNNMPVGFISYGQGRDEEYKNTGEIYAVYLLKKASAQGIGYQLFQVAKDKLVQMGFSAIYLWVLDSNKNAINAYQKWGGKIVLNQEKYGDIDGQSIREIMISFEL